MPRSEVTSFIMEMDLWLGRKGPKRGWCLGNVGQWEANTQKTKCQPSFLLRLSSVGVENVVVYLEILGWSCMQLF